MYLWLFQVSQMDAEMLRITALHIIFDLLLTFGLDAFQVNSVSILKYAVQ